MNAKQRRMQARRVEKRHGLSDRQFRIYNAAVRQGYGHDSAYIKAVCS